MELGKETEGPKQSGSIYYFGVYTVYTLTHRAARLIKTEKAFPMRVETKWLAINN